ncbi:trafficking protein mon1 subfamily protein [Acanthamoeba castellanii str. Neff]|uniref:Trafficking protein mon1 subfamily protein n=1 Tax=Acanthamoeba castellanii (strain ATCC 30010 / Neff) TaxID=1257118 RepID=L8HDN6_ACACF|nr:trafficking protein mon1 subfamily protein [Acanthamoeba castellanii str. Neff]ELR22506.1 trafficking protein mon1 subfamily protein [Acanthamoeba castellanii str. Neff]
MESSDDAIDLADEVSVLDLDTSADLYDDDGNMPKPRKTRKNREGEEEDYYFQHEWPHHKKHVFILSNSGKPVYSRHGDEQKLCAHKIVFLFKGPLHLVAVSRTDEPATHLARQLEYIHSQILSSLTSGVKKIYDSRAHFDIRTLLGDSTHLIDSLIDSMEHDMLFLSSCFLNAVYCFPLDATTRHATGVVMQSYHTDEIVYTLLLARQQLVNVVRLKKHALHSEDFHLIVNFLSNATSIKQTESSTSPVCLPRFNDRGYLHFYTTFLSKEVCLILISTKAGNFEAGKNQIERGLREVGALRTIRESLERNANSKHHYSVDDVLGPLKEEMDAKESGGLAMLSAAFTSPVTSSPSSSSPSSMSPSSSSGSLSSIISSASSLSTSSVASSTSTSSSSQTSPSSSSSSTVGARSTAAAQAARATLSSSAPQLSSVTSSTLLSLSSSSAFPSFASAGTSLLLSAAASLTPSSRYLLHFLFEPPYINAKEQKRLFRLYQRVQYRVNESMVLGEARKDKNSSRVFYYISTRESMVAWVTSGFEVYATFGPLVPKPTALKICNQILKWIRNEEANLFILNAPVW